jgi:chromosome segregation ATPase
MNPIKEAFERVKEDINELRGEMKKVLERINHLTEEVRELKKRKITRNRKIVKRISKKIKR